MIDFVKKLARKAGSLCLEEASSPCAVHFKSPKDLVTQTDQKVEALICKEIKERFPDHGILGEETGEQAGTGPYRWVIDPIDGTTSFVHGQPFYSVSIALEKEGEQVLGVVYAPVLDELYHAEKGKGAFLNDSPIEVSQTAAMDQAVMATGFACLRSDLPQNNLDNFNRIILELRDIRRYGSAAVDLCFTAAGRLDGFWELNLNIYDIAAGVLILKEAGGRVTDFRGEKQFPARGIAGANPHLQPRLVEMLRDHPFAERQ